MERTIVCPRVFLAGDHSDLLEAEIALLRPHLQDWVKYKGLRVIVVFEGRDAAGKRGTIRAITGRVSPRVPARCPPKSVGSRENSDVP